MEAELKVKPKRGPSLKNKNSVMENVQLVFFLT